MRPAASLPKDESELGRLAMPALPILAADREGAYDNRKGLGRLKLIAQLYRGRETI